LAVVILDRLYGRAHPLHVDAFLQPKRGVGAPNLYRCGI
jgi:hypothetical protein